MIQHKRIKKLGYLHYQKKIPNQDDEAIQQNNENMRFLFS